MKRLLAVIIAPLFFNCLFAACGESSNTQQDIQLTGSIQVMQSVFDDQQSTLYIRVEHPGVAGADAAVADIIAKKRSWEKQFPNKEIKAMTIVTGDGGGYGHPIVVGLLIHYEERQNQRVR